MFWPSLMEEEDKHCGELSIEEVRGGIFQAESQAQVFQLVLTRSRGPSWPFELSM